jgi:DNA polymerase III alpha subunit (gram-positive type)
LVTTFGIELPQAHRALHDARATAQLLIKFLKILQNGGLKQLKDIPHIQNLPKLADKPVEGQVSLF